MNDDELLQRLSQALAPEPLEPPQASVLAVRRAVTAHRGTRRRMRWRGRAVAVAAVFSTVLAGSSAAFALSGAPLPRPLRIVSNSVGLPVDSVAMADARSATSDLRRALSHRDAARVAEESRVLRARLSRLDANERGQIEHEATSLLEDANQAGAQGQVEHQDQRTSAPTTTPGVGGSDRAGDQGGLGGAQIAPGPEGASPQGLSISGGSSGSGSGAGSGGNQATGGAEGSPSGPSTDELRGAGG